ncbi:MAG TPA: nitrite/sulfite reductase [Actinomycetota bacterium]|nr:nitrite/sulfite reductase [Actinomycetota bacterium]
MCQTCGCWEPDARPKSRSRGEAQWALGYREPQSLAEQTKKEDDGLNVRARIEDVYSKKGFASIWPGDLRSRFRWHGLYTQRPEVDGYFMLRIRIPGGQLTSEQTDVIGRISERYGRDVADVTDRQNVQLHWIRIEDMPEIWRELEAVDLSTTEACGDTPRNLLSCPLAGIDSTEVIDASEVLRNANAALVNDYAFSNLPRKYKISISGCAHQCAQHEINDVGLVGVKHPSGEVGFDVWVGGGLSTNPMFGKRLGAFVPPDQVVPVVLGITSVFRDWGYRRVRNRARLKFLVQDWGPMKFREVLEEELGFSLEDLDPPPTPNGLVHREHVGIGKQKDGKSYIGFAPKAGRIQGHQLRAIARLARRFGDGRLRTTTQQKMVILDVEPGRVDELVEELDALDLPVLATNWRRGAMACTGIEFCKLAIVETKGRAVEIYRYLEKALPGYEDEIRINVNGCPNSCARYQTADIGLMGCIISERTWVMDHDGNQIEERRKVEAFLVHLGGHLGTDRSFGRKAKGVKVLASEAGPYIETLIRRYHADRDDAERFSTFVNRLSDKEFLEFSRKPVFHNLPPAPTVIAEPRAS